MEDVQLSKTIAAIMQLRLPGTVGKIASKMRYVDEIAPRLREGGLIRAIPELHLDRAHAVAISTKSNSLPAFGGVLYGAAALRQDIFVEQKQVVRSHQDSRVDISDMNFLDTAQRLTWHEYRLAYELLNDLFDQGPLPDLVLLDLPLLIVRGAQTSSLDDEDVSAGWAAVMDVMSRFWGRWLPRCYPSDPEGPFVVALGRRYFGAILNAVHAQGYTGSLEPLNEEVVGLVQQEWMTLRQAGIMRVLSSLLRVGKRTAAYPYTALGKDVLRAAPRSLGMHGLIGFHLQVGYRTPVWQVETIGPASAWDSAHLDHLAGLVAYLTLYDHPSVWPLPLWYAKRLVHMPQGVLRTYRSRTMELLREGTIDQAWLEGIDTLADEGNFMPELDMG
ncbi:MAG TPA: hypothetical protein DEP84_28100 [Chloroflexi bacterium]|nr:hypothetical protein [Chloroflexota bacterium]